MLLPRHVKHYYEGLWRSLNIVLIQPKSTKVRLALPIDCMHAYLLSNITFSPPLRNAEQKPRSTRFKIEVGSTGIVYYSICNMICCICHPLLEVINTAINP